ncbi:hypothetical protein F4780DRAFT_789772 [Xylariomycetidae sp. FL0641]|nr:hypothetical protein F4780DRAFT_789772 [Xylariomycetidae sp. FL0641]
MAPIIKITLLLGTCLSLVSGGVVTTLPGGYTVVPMTWKGTNTTDGSEVAVSGTIQEIESQIDALGSEVDWTYHADASIASRSAERRSKTNTFCFIAGEDGAPDANLNEGIHYLKGIRDRPCVAAPGPKVCTRISCSWNAGIYFCNDTPSEVHHDCPDIATYAEDIRAKCHYTSLDRVIVQGQEFDSENWNVMIAGDHC